jgi:hypothetical protein
MTFTSSISAAVSISSDDHRLRDASNSSAVSCASTAGAAFRIAVCVADSGGRWSIRTLSLRGDSR